MTLPAIADRLEDLPEAVRPHYVATADGRWRLDAEGVEDVTGLKSALEKERAARKALQAEVAQAEVLPAEVVPAEPGVPAIEDEEDAGIAAEPGTDPRLTALESRLIEAEARSALQAVRGVPELLLPVLRGRLAVAEDGAGGLAVRVLDEAGTALRREDGGGFVTVAERKGVVEGKSVSVRVGRGGSATI